MYQRGREWQSDCCTREQDRADEFVKPLMAAALAFPLPGGTAAARGQPAAKVLRVIPSADPAELDPTKALNLIGRIYSQMVFDTLFALDSQLAPKPMMVESETGQRRTA